ncbi:hypothetical protein BC826DRAFT_1182433 [Russula brevipes]|nr:hypothetical protein BC826DRAFT_1182433 [Russula brevipes]
MSSVALGVAFAAVQLVHQAHTKVKTSKARCARLVERCQLVVDRLERIAATRGGDTIIRGRIHELERAFEHTAQTIIHVGQQGIIASLLRSEANALLIDSCNEALTELISLFNLEEIVDVRRWQTDLEVARVRDHRELLSMGRRIESGNAAIHCELAQQGATITEVLRVVHAPGTPQPTARAKAKMTSLGTPESSSTPCSPRSGTATAAAKSKSKPKPEPGNATPRPLVHEEMRKAGAARKRLLETVVVLASSSFVSFASQMTDDGVRSALARFPPPPVADPPPPYQLRVANPAPERESTAVEGGGGTANRASPAPVSSSRFTAASVEAIRAPDSPVPTFPSPKPSSTESVFGSTESLASSFQSSGSATISALRRLRRNSTAAAGPTLPVLRRRDTIRSPLRITLSSGYLDVRPMFRSS